ncbi:hypothetical protein NX059_004381 [Plenodomus lindquistii]|nr:hypothetical protein NX059_004381 [Plenodomus lindquistii]
MAYNNNYQPPVHGSPFPFPFPPQSHSQADEQRGHSHSHSQSHAHMQHAPPHNVFQNIPGLQQPPPAPAPAPALPGFNFTSHAHNSQQPPFPSAGVWPPQLPPDAHMWMSMMQQHGVFPPPPPIAGLPVPPASLPQPPQNHPMPMRFPPQPPPPQSYPLPPTPVRERIQEVMESDREDGELSEGDGASRGPTTRANGKATVEAPRSVPQPTPSSSRAEEAYNPDHPAAGQTPSKPSVSVQAQPESPPSPQVQFQKDREAAKQFIKLLNNNGISYHNLAQEQLDPQLLRDLYQSANLPSEPAPIPLPKDDKNTTEKSKTGQPTNQTDQLAESKTTKHSAPTITTNIAASTTTKPAASPVTRGDRTDYVARLQAARMAKQAAEGKPSTPQQIPQAKPSTKPATPAPAVQAPLTPQATPTPAPAVIAPMTDEQRRARTTELVKQRLKELKGQPKPAPPVKNNSAADAIPKQAESLPVAPNSIPSATATANAQTDPAPVPAFPGIPGLFMSTQAHDRRGTATPSRSASSVPQKRPVPSDSTGASTPRDSVTPYTRPLGQSPHAHHDEEESMIIQVSDDESNGSEMDLDDDEPTQKPSAGSSTALPSRPQGVGALSNLPSRSGSIRPASSAVSTPGPQTPSTQAREKELEDKEKQLAAMRLTLKKKLAEKREKDRAAAAAAAAAAAVTTSSPSRQPISVPTPRPNEVANPGMTTSTTDIGTSSASATRTVTDSGRDHKRQRRAELQAQLPSLDAEIASNASRMAQLTEEMNKLLAESKKITEAKEQLTKELEDLGIDTEGMSHAQLQAKKDEIEREKSPEKESPAQNASHGELQAPSTKEPAITKAALLPTQVIQPPSNNYTTQFAGLPGLGASTPLATSAAPEIQAHPSLPVLDNDITSSHVSQVSVQPATSGLDRTKTNNANAGTASEQDLGTPLDDEEDFYSPPPPGDMDLDLDTTSKANPHVPTKPVDDVPVSPEEEGEVEMSESSDDEDEEEYEPEEPAVDTETIPQETQASGTDLGRSLATSQISTEDEEDYEPPDVDRGMADDGHDAATTDTGNATTDTGNTTAAVEAGDDEMDIATSSSEDSSDSDSDSDDETASEPDSVSGPSVLPQPTATANDVAPEWQVTDAAPTGVPDSVVPVVEDVLPKFTPYESPLRMFKSYRYHPGYADEVPGGFLSWTFSHQIDPQKRLCQYESAGGSCNDSTCVDQHFRDFGITGA